MLKVLNVTKRFLSNKNLKTLREMQKIRNEITGFSFPYGNEVTSNATHKDTEEVLRNFDKNLSKSRKDWKKGSVY